MPPYKPLPVPIPTLDASVTRDLGSLVTEFEPFVPDPQFTFAGRMRPATWTIIQPKTAPPIGELPQLITRLIKATWKFAEPSRDNTRGSTPSRPGHGISIGTRGGPAPSGSAQYSPQVRPTGSVIQTTLASDTAIASDWKVFNWIRRTNAVTFRGDSRSPNDVIAKAGGFYPPNSRTDRYYLENNIYNEFADYLQRRYNRPLSKDDFLKAVDTTATSPWDQSVLVDYLMWRKITEREAVHLGRMVENECLKGYISTARSIDTSLHFATGYGSRPGWLYLTVVHGGFVVPGGDQHYWGSQEAEIAQWGPIKAEQIVGFVHVTPNAQQVGIPDGPIFMRRSFRTGEPEAFEYMFKVMCGAVPA